MDYHGCAPSANAKEISFGPLSRRIMAGYRSQKARGTFNDFYSNLGLIYLFDETPADANSEQLRRVVDRINSTG
jgi:hypothetical protein